MNETVNNFLLSGDKLISGIHLRQPGFTYSACGSFTRNRKRIQKSKYAGDSQYIYENKLDKACFQHDMAYRDFKKLTRRIVSDKILRNKHLMLLKIQNLMDIKEILLQWFTNFLIKESSGANISGGAVKTNY